VFGYDYKGGDTIIEYGLLLRPKRDDKELESNCCGARVDSLNAENIGICSECKEGCGVEYQSHHFNKNGICIRCGVVYARMKSGYCWHKDDLYPLEKEVENE